MEIDKSASRELLRRSIHSVGNSLDSHILSEMGIPSYLDGNRLSRWAAWKKVEHVLAMCGNARNCRILDFGCGSGIMLAILGRAAQEMYAADICLDLARETARQAGLEKINFLDACDVARDVPSGTMDLVVAANVLEHVSDLDGVIGTLSDKLSKGGCLIVSSPTENFTYRLGRQALRLMGHKAFSGDYHERSWGEIWNCLSSHNLVEKAQVQIPLPGIMCLYKIGKFEKQ